MTLHAVFGDGEMTRKELVATLDDLWQKNEKTGDGNFWFLLQGKSDPTATDKGLCAWLDSNDLFYAVITDDEDSMDRCYNPAQTFKAKKLTQKVISLLESEPEEGEDIDVLALFVSDDPDSEEDRWLNDLLGEINESGYGPIRALNDGLVELDFEPEAEEAEAEEAEAEEEPEEKPSKAPSKKAAKKKAEEPAAEPYGGVDVTSRKELEGLNIGQIKEIAAEMGIELPPRTRSSTYISAILGEDDDDTPAAEVSEPEPVNDEAVDIDLITAQVMAKVNERLDDFRESLRNALG